MFRAGCGIRLYRFLIVAFLSTLDNISLCMLSRVFYYILINRHCSKDIVTSIVYTYNHRKYFCIYILFVLGVCMFDGIAEHEGRKTVAHLEVFTKLLFFPTVSF